MKPSKQPTNLAGQLIIGTFIIALILPFVGSKYINTQIVKEQASTLQVYGMATGAKLTQRADGWFRLWAIQSGLMNRAIHGMDQSSTGSLIGNAIKSGAQTSVNASAVGQVATVAGVKGTPQEKSHRIWYWWITAAFSLMYFAMLRISVLVFWVPMLVPVCAAILVTGSTRQRLKQHGFGGIDPLRYRAGIRLSAWAPAFAVSSLFLPGALPPVVTPALVALTFTGIAMMMANRQKPV